MKKKKEITPKVMYEELMIDCGWIPVLLGMDYRSMTVSLLERNGAKKQYMFCWRGISYQAWWNKILKAMQEAMDIWFAKLNERNDENVEKYIESSDLLTNK